MANSLEGEAMSHSFGQENHRHHRRFLDVVVRRLSYTRVVITIIVVIRHVVVRHRHHDTESPFASSSPPSPPISIYIAHCYMPRDSTILLLHTARSLFGSIR